MGAQLAKNGISNAMKVVLDGECLAFRFQDGVADHYAVQDVPRVNVNATSTRMLHVPEYNSTINRYVALHS